MRTGVCGNSTTNKTMSTGMETLLNEKLLSKQFLLFFFCLIYVALNRNCYGNIHFDVKVSMLFPQVELISLLVGMLAQDLILILFHKTKPLRKEEKNCNGCAWWGGVCVCDFKLNEDNQVMDSILWRQNKTYCFCSFQTWHLNKMFLIAYGSLSFIS